MSVTRLLTIPLLLVVGPGQALGTYRIFARADGFAYSEPVRLSATEREWEAPFEGRQKALLHTAVETGMAHHHWSAAMVWRKDVRATASSETAEFFDRTQKKLPLDAGRTYNIDFDYREVTSRGVRVAYRNRIDSGLNFEIGVSLLKGLSFQSGRLSGSATPTATGDYEFDIDVDYRYSRDRLLGFSDVSGPGNGFSTDLRLSWLGRYGRVSLALQDLYGVIEWKDAPYTVAKALPAVKQFDDQGFLDHVTPSLQGQVTYERFKQKLPRYALIRSELYAGARYSLLANLIVADRMVLPSIGVGYQLGADWKIESLYHTESRSLELGLVSPFGALRISSDSLKLGDGHQLGVAFDLSYGF